MKTAWRGLTNRLYIAVAGFKKKDAEEVRKVIKESREVDEMVYALETAIRKKLE